MTEKLLGFKEKDAKFSSGFAKTGNISEYIVKEIDCFPVVSLEEHKKAIEELGKTIDYWKNAWNQEKCDWIRITNEAHNERRKLEQQLSEKDKEIKELKEGSKNLAGIIEVFNPKLNMQYLKPKELQQLLEGLREKEGLK